MDFSQVFVRYPTEIEKIQVEMSEISNGSFELW